MRWDRLFDDLQAQMDAEGQRELDLEVSDRTRRERAQVGVHERLIAHRGGRVELRLAAGVLVSGNVADAGSDWLLLDDPGRRGSLGDGDTLAPFGASLVPFAAIVSITGLGFRAASGPGVATAKRFGLGYALRGLSRDRSVVSLTDIGGSMTTGTIDAVGADALDLSEHPVDVARRTSNVIARRVIPFSAIVVVRNG
ncbi:MAG: hypothetical protein ABI934_07905 [Actinomycetota bacterium]